MSPLFDVLFIEVNPTPVKAALSMMGRIEYEYRLPLCEMAPENYDKLKKVMEKLRPESRDRDKIMII